MNDSCSWLLSLFMCQGKNKMKRERKKERRWTDRGRDKVRQSWKKGYYGERSWQRELGVKSSRFEQYPCALEINTCSQPFDWWSYLRSALDAGWPGSKVCATDITLLAVNQIQSSQIKLSDVPKHWYWFSTLSPYLFWWRTRNIGKSFTGRFSCSFSMH